MKYSITLDNVSVDYPAHADKRGLSSLVSAFKGKKNTFRSLSNVNLQILQGERVGLIGLNGAGKSTILKIMAKIYHPTSGTCEVKGRICPLFEFATGFEMDMSGWANIKIRAKLLGMSPKEIEQVLPEIAAFTELGDFLNNPVRTYSAGMFIRLAFATSTALTPEILLLDEVVGAGDIAFTKKASQRMESFMDKGQILVLSTHAPDLLKRFCERTIWLHKGEIMMDGPTDDVWKEYSKDMELLTA